MTYSKHSAQIQLRDGRRILGAQDELEFIGKWLNGYYLPAVPKDTKR